jgi:myosin-5
MLKLLYIFFNAGSSHNLIELNVCQGKLIEIHFSETGKISGANIQTCRFSAV